jgi:lipid-binding SYLF domain-containing protein
LPHNELETFPTHRIISRFVATTFIMLFAFAAWAADKSKDEETLRNAATVLQSMIDGKNVPTDVLARANCVVVLPSVKKFGVGIGGSGGRGPMVCREGPNFSGRWSAPAMYSVGGASVGLQVGGSSSDFVLLVMSQKAVDALLAGETKLGRDATAAAGPSGATTAGAVGGSDILTYGRSSGLFAGVSMSGASLEPDKDANKRLYHADLGAKEILFGPSVKPTPGGMSLDSVLNGAIAQHKS